METLIETRHNFNSSFPEDFPWWVITQNSLATVALAIVKRIRDDLKTRNRNETPGLRASLVEIAKVATMTIHGS